MTKTFTLSTIFIIILSSVAFAGLHTWKDANGVMHFSDDPPAKKELLNKKSGYREIIKSEICNVPVYIISNAIDSRSKFNGTYYPVEPSSEGFPQYNKRKEKSDRNRKEKLSVEEVKGKWRWVISNGYRDKFYSNTVPEGTAPSRAVKWFERKETIAPINVIEKKLAMRNSRFEYVYIYDTYDILPDMRQWMKKGFEIDGLPIQQLNGKYYPVQWSSPVPRYTNGQNVYLTAHHYGDRWEWKIIRRGKTEFSSDSEPKGTMADKVQKWYEVRGTLYLTISVKEFTLEK